MFNNKYLKQLRTTQALIKHCKESIEKLKSPQLNSPKDIVKVYEVLKPMLVGNSLSIGEFLELSDTSIEYIQQVGRFLLNITDYANTIQMYKAMIAQLQKEERDLKAKLGIE